MLSNKVIFLHFAFLLTVVQYPITKLKNASEFVLCFVSLFVLKKEMAQSNPEPFPFVFSSFFFNEHRLHGQPLCFGSTAFIR